MAETTFGWQEYIVFGAVLAVSLLIGVFFAFFGRNKTNEEFLMAGRSMGILPVTLSLICSFVSAILMLGSPLEVYNYGVQYYSMVLAFIPMTAALIFLYVPVYFDLQLTSAYEYFERRFNKKVRKIISISAIIHLLLYMPTTVYGPALALDQVSGLNRFMSSAAIFIVCIIYSSIGGLKAVLWTDALQALIMMGSIITVIVFGMIELGGSEFMWEAAKFTGRDKFFELDGDPRTRFTLWAAIFGNYFNWITLFGATQAQIQRYNSVATLRKAQISLFLNMLGLMFFLFLLSLAGLTMFAYYYSCDPIAFGRVEQADQILPLFVIDIMGDIKGLPGLFVAGVTAGSLSSVSSALNALPGIIIEDFVKDYKPDWGESKLVWTSKMISVGSGLVAFALVFVIASVGDILPFVSLLHGTFLGPIFALFTLGLFFPWANSIGSAMGMICGLVLTLFIGLGSILAGNDKKLPNQKRLLQTFGCPANETMMSFFEPNFDPSQFSYISNIEAPYDTWKELSKDDSNLLKLFSLSYLYQPLITVVSSIFFGLLFSIIINACTSSKPRVKVNKRYLSGPILALWNLILPRSFMDKWVDNTQIILKTDKHESLRRIETIESYFSDGMKSPDNYGSTDKTEVLDRKIHEKEPEVFEKVEEIVQNDEKSEIEPEVDLENDQIETETEPEGNFEREMSIRMQKMEPMDWVMTELKMKLNDNIEEENAQT